MVPGFILKLWKIVNSQEPDKPIAWSDNGQSFIILDQSRFAQLLPQYFKHNNLSSFVRQLNMYGFRKLTTLETSPGSDDLIFYHPDFIRDRPDKLENIKRKMPQKLSETIDLKNVYKGISEIEEKQQDVSRTLTEIKKENEMLWAELHDLRQKHQQQQIYMSRLMKLVFEAMEQNGIKTNMLHTKRQIPLMIDSAPQVLQEMVPQEVIIQPISTETQQLQTVQQQELTHPPQQQQQTSHLPAVESPGAITMATDNNETPGTSAYHSIEETIINNGDQIDNFVPDLCDFADEEMVKLFTP